MELAPIGVSTYSRINHLKQTVEALQKNTLAQESELYIFSDAPQEGDEEIVAKVREYIHTIDGFKKVHIVERETNGRVANSRGGFQWLLDNYGKVIFLEDDIVTAPGFLRYMNDALEFYRNDEKIITVSGYCPPIKLPKNYKDDVFILQRHSSWGSATWKHKLNLFDLDLKDHDFEDFLQDKQAIKKFHQNGQDLTEMCIRDYEGKLDALDVKLVYFQYKYNKFSLFPSNSLVQNIGHDGSGLHCGVSKKFEHEKLWDKTENFNFINNLKVDERIRKANYRFAKSSFRYNLGQLLRSLKLYNITNRIYLFIKQQCINEKL